MTAFLLLLMLAQGQDFTWSGSIASGKRLTVKNVIGDVRVELTGGSTASVTGPSGPVVTATPRMWWCGSCRPGKE